MLSLPFHICGVAQIVELRDLQENKVPVFERGGWLC